jgi:hypothetical protein
MAPVAAAGVPGRAGGRVTSDERFDRLMVLVVHGFELAVARSSSASSS